MKHLSRMEVKAFLKYLFITLLVFLVFGTIQLGVMMRAHFELRLLIVPILLSLVMGSLLGINAVLRMRLRIANQVKSDFISRISHELRTPMTSIIGFSQYMRHQDDLGDKYRQQSDKIYRAGEHLLGLINDLLDMGKIEAGKVPIKLESVSITELADECLLMLQPLVEDANIQIHKQLDGPSISPIMVDRIRFRQVLMNILSNAVKYNHAGGSVTLLAEPHGKWLRLSVVDSGDGMPKEFVEHVFEPFTRHPEHADKVGGVGIGMTITRNLVELMGGHIGLESKPGVGTRVWVEFPRATNVELPEQHPGRV